MEQVWPSQRLVVPLQLETRAVHWRRYSFIKTPGHETLERSCHIWWVAFRCYYLWCSILSFVSTRSSMVSSILRWDFSYRWGLSKSPARERVQLQWDPAWELGPWDNKRPAASSVLGCGSFSWDQGILSIATQRELIVAIFDYCCYH